MSKDYFKFSSCYVVEFLCLSQAWNHIPDVVIAFHRLKLILTHVSHSALFPSQSTYGKTGPTQVLFVMPGKTGTA